MPATSDAAKHCPRCQTPLDPAAYAAGLPFACTRCGAQVQRKPASGENDAPQSVSAEDGGLLVDLQELLLRMLVGIFQFIFIQLPTEIVHTIIRWFPTLIRLGNVIVLFALWLGAAFGPLALSLCREGREFPWMSPPLPVPEFYLHHAAVFDHTLVAYTILALYGSAWGAVRIRRRRRRRREAAGRR